MKRSTSLMLSVIAAALLFAGQVSAAPGAGPCGQPPCPGFEGPCQGSGLERGPQPMPVQRITDQQRAQYYAIMSEYEPKLREFADQLFVKENELQALKHAVQPDVNAVRATAEEIVKLRNQRRALKRTIDARLEKECGIKRPQKPIPGVDIPYRPFRGHHGPRGMHGPMGPGSAPHGPHHEM